MIQFSPFFINGFNFFILCSFFLYLIVKKILPSYKKQIRDQAQEEEEKIVLMKDFEKKKLNLSALNEKQKALIIDLQEKISQWCSIVDQEQEKNVKRLTHQQDRMREKKAQLYEALFVKKLQQAAFAKALMTAKKQIADIFSKKNVQEAYLIELCNYNAKKVFNE